MVYKPIGKRRILLLLLVLTVLSALLFLLGRKQETAAVTANSKTLVIDPGHGGIDSGALGADGTRESDINLAIALKLRAVAELYGQENTLIRQDDSSKCDTEDYSEHRDLECRTELVCAERNPVYISIHQNHFPTAQAGGAQVIYASATMTGSTTTTGITILTTTGTGTATGDLRHTAWSFPQKRLPDSVNLHYSLA